jgi:hypothetical protein
MTSGFTAVLLWREMASMPFQKNKQFDWFLIKLKYIINQLCFFYYELYQLFALYLNPCILFWSSSKQLAHLKFNFRYLCIIQQSWSIFGGTSQKLITQPTFYQGFCCMSQRFLQKCRNGTTKHLAAKYFYFYFKIYDKVS